MHIISITNSKGGSGKTTFAVNLASMLAHLGQKTVLIDLDPQSHCCTSLAIPKKQPIFTDDVSEGDEQVSTDQHHDLFSAILLNPGVKENELPELIETQAWQMSRHLTVLPASEKLNDSVIELLMQKHLKPANLLHVRIQKAFPDANFVIIDTASSKHPITQLVNHFSDRLIVPTNSTYLNIESANELVNQSGAHTEIQKIIDWVGMNFDPQNSDNKRAVQLLGLERCLGMVPHDKLFIEATQVGRAAMHLDPSNQAIKLLEEMAIKIISHINTGKTPNQFSTSDRDHGLADSVPKPRLSRAAELVERARQLTARKPEATMKIESATKPSETDRHFGVQVQNDTLRFTQPLNSASQMAIVGNFGLVGTEIHPMSRNESEDVWEAQIQVNPGNYHYQLVVDGELASDPYNAPVSNLGSQVSTKEGKSDWQKTA